MKNKIIAGTDKIDELTFYSLFNVLQAGMWLQNDIEKFLKKYGLSHGRFSILLSILENGNNQMIQSSIALFLGRSRPTIAKMLRSLQQEGLVQAEPSPKDKREKEFHLTKEGTELLNKIIPEYNKRLLSIGANLEEPDKIELMTLLSKLNYPDHGKKIEVRHA